MASSKDGPRAYFFDNPRRYDSDEDVSAARSYNSRNGWVTVYLFDTPQTYKGMTIEGVHAPRA